MYKRQLEEGRSAELAYQVYKYATEQIDTGCSRRSDLKNRLLSAIKTADTILAEDLQKLAAQKKLTDEMLRQLMEDHVSVMHLPDRLAESREESESRDSGIEMPLLRHERGLLDGYRDSVEH